MGPLLHERQPFPAEARSNAMSARVPPPPDFNPNDPVDVAGQNDREREAFEQAWEVLRAGTLGPIVVMIDSKRVRYSSQPGKNAIEAVFQVGHLAGLEMVCAALRRMLGVP
jgi:hypothetical protein